jgi:hypothetical protein
MTCSAHPTVSTPSATAESELAWIEKYVSTTPVQSGTANLNLESLMKTANKILRCFDQLSWTREGAGSPLLADGYRGIPIYPLLAYHLGLARASSAIRLRLDSHSTRLTSADPVRGLAVTWMIARLEREEDNIKDQQFDALGFARRGGKPCTDFNVQKFGTKGSIRPHERMIVSSISQKASTFWNR